MGLKGSLWGTQWGTVGHNEPQWGTQWVSMGHNETQWVSKGLYGALNGSLWGTIRRNGSLWGTQWGTVGPYGALNGARWVAMGLSMGPPHISPPPPPSGYARVALSAVSVVLMPHSPLPAALCYALSAALDAVDGLAARWLNQGGRDFRVGGTSGLGDFREGASRGGRGGIVGLEGTSGGDFREGDFREGLRREGVGRDYGGRGDSGGWDFRGGVPALTP